MAAERGPDTPAMVTTAVKRKVSWELLATKSFDASLALPTPAASAIAYPTHTAKLFFTPWKNRLEATSSHRNRRMQVRDAASTLSNVLDIAACSRRWPA
jgi:hypothetical protein